MSDHNTVTTQTNLHFPAKNLWQKDLDSIIHSARPKSNQDSYAYKIQCLTCIATSQVGSVLFSCDILAIILGYMDANYTEKI